MRRCLKWYLKRLLGSLMTMIVVLFFVVAASLSFRWWYVSIPTAGAAVVSAVAIFLYGVIRFDFK